MDSGGVRHTFHFLIGAAGLAIPKGLPNPYISELTSDSRKAKKGSLFLGVPGQQVDGGNFWKQAVSRGAVAAVISSLAADMNPPSRGDAVMILPEPVGHFLGELAAAFWEEPSSKMCLIGVTGTNGKTTTTHLIEHLLGVVGKPSALFGTLINRWPGKSIVSNHTTAFADTLQAHLAEALSAGAEFAAMEVSSHALAQNRVSGCHFSGAIFTNLTQDHLDYHISMDKYFQAKMSLFKAPLMQPYLTSSVVNVDDKWGMKLASYLGNRCWRASLHSDRFSAPFPELAITDIEVTPQGTQGLMHTPAGKGIFLSPLVGKFNLMNLLQSVGSLVQQGLPLSDLLEGVSSFPGVPGRMEKINTGLDAMNLPAVLVDYAHTPDGLRNAILASRFVSKGKLICVFGCGGDRDSSKRPKMGSIAHQLADIVVVTSDNPRTEDPHQILNEILVGIPSRENIFVEIDRALAIEFAISKANSNDLVLIAGKGHEDYQIVGTTKINFDDRKVALNILFKRVNNQTFPK